MQEERGCRNRETIARRYQYQHGVAVVGKENVRVIENKWRSVRTHLDMNAYARHSPHSPFQSKPKVVSTTPAHSRAELCIVRVLVR
jgi:hypothetical protein